MLGYDLEEERREERPREPRTYDNEDEPVDVEGDSLGWPDAAINVDGRHSVLVAMLNFCPDLPIITLQSTLTGSPDKCGWNCEKAPITSLIITIVARRQYERRYITVESYLYTPAEQRPPRFAVSGYGRSIL